MSAPASPVDDTVLDFHGVNRSSLGQLGTIPLELLEEVTRYCTLHALISLGFVNRFATLLVSSSSPYTLLATHVPALLTTLLHTDTAFYFTTQEVYDVLCSPSCCVCGFYGQYMYMPECVRCCERCLRQSPRFWPITATTIEKAYGITLKALRETDIPIIKSLRGTRINDRNEEVRMTRGIFYMSERSAWEVAVRWHGREDVLERYVNRRPMSKQLHEARLNGWDWLIPDEEHASRFRATAYLPYFNSSTGTVERGLSCRGCRARARRLPSTITYNASSVAHHRETLRLVGRAYTRKHFLQHVQKCEPCGELLRIKGWKQPDQVPPMHGTYPSGVRETFVNSMDRRRSCRGT